MDPLALTGWHILKIDDTIPGQYTISIAMDDPKPQQCVETPGCFEAGKPRKFGATTLHIRDLPMHGRLVDLRIRRQRYQCRCCKTVSASVVGEGTLGPDIHEKHRMTTRLLTYVKKNAAHRTFVDVGREVGLSDKTIERIFSEHGSVFSKDIKVKSPRVLGIDDIFISGDWYTVFADVENQTLLDIYSNNGTESLSSVLDRMGAGKDQIEVVCQNMSSVYRKFSEDQSLGPPGGRIARDSSHSFSSGAAAAA